VAAEDGTDVVKRARFENGLRPFAYFLRGLEHDEHVASGGLSREEERGAHCPGAVNVVSAGVHDAGRRRGERQPRRLFDRERVDVTAHRNDGCGAVTPRETRDDPRPCHTRDVRRTEGRHGGREAIRRALLLP